MAAVAVPVLVAAATPSPTIKPVITAKPLTVADDNGGLTKSSTATAHLTSSFQRIGVTDRTQAALWAERDGLRR